MRIDRFEFSVDDRVLRVTPIRARFEAAVLTASWRTPGWAIGKQNDSWVLSWVAEFWQPATCSRIFPDGDDRVHISVNLSVAEWHGLLRFIAENLYGGAPVAVFDEDGTLVEQL